MAALFPANIVLARARGARLGRLEGPGLVISSGESSEREERSVLLGKSDVVPNVLVETLE